MNSIACPKCGNVMRTVALGWMCNECQCFIDMQENVHEHKDEPFMPPQTKADRMRAMSDEEMAKSRTRFVSDPEDEGGYENDAGWFFSYETAIQRELDWLRSEADT